MIFFFPRSVFCLMSLKCCCAVYVWKQHIGHLKGKETKQHPTLPTKGEYTSLPNAVHFGDASTPSRTTENSLASTSWPVVFVSFTETSWNVSDQRKICYQKTFANNFMNVHYTSDLHSVHLNKKSRILEGTNVWELYNASQKNIV